MDQVLCVPKVLPLEDWIHAAAAATAINPANAPDQSALAYMPGFHPEPIHIAALTSCYWGSKGVDLGVQFMDNPPAALKASILRHCNVWGQYGNVTFRETGGSGEVRIARQRGQGHYSYLGTDILQVPRGQCTMNLDGFSLDTPEAELARVIQHEAGHTLGFVHEHLRRAVVGRIDQMRAVAYYARTQGWSRATTVSQVLTPVEERALLAPPAADEDSIMAYQLPAEIMTDGRAVPGGTVLSESDKAYVGKIYPREKTPVVHGRVVFSDQVRAGQYILVLDEPN